MPRSLRRIIETVTTAEAAVIILTTVSALGAGWWARVANSGPLLIPIIFVTIASGVLIAERVNTYKQRRPISNSKVGRTVRNWLDEGGYHVRTENEPGMDFLYHVQDQEQRPYKVGRLESRPESLIIVNGVSLSPNALSQVSKLTRQARIELFTDLRIELSRNDIGYRYIQPDSILYSVEYEIPCTSLNKYEFYRSMRLVRHGVIAMRQLLIKHLSRSEGEAAVEAGTQFKAPNPQTSGRTDSQP